MFHSRAFQLLLLCNKLSPNLVASQVTTVLSFTNPQLGQDMLHAGSARMAQGWSTESMKAPSLTWPLLGAGFGLECQFFPLCAWTSLATLIAFELKGKYPERENQVEGALSFLS